MNVFEKINCGDNPWLYARLVSDLKVRGTGPEQTEG
jgi:hypothetical protein